MLRPHAFVACGAAVWGWRTRGVGGQRRAGKPLGGEGNAMQRTASRDGATPCTLPLEKQLQQNLQATLLKQNGCPYDHHRLVSFPRALTPELTAPGPGPTFRCLTPRRSNDGTTIQVDVVSAQGGHSNVYFTGTCTVNGVTGTVRRAR